MKVDIAPGERRQITVLFADMAGYTAIAERLGEEGAYELIQPIYTIMADAIRELNGIVKDFTGDGIMALFGVPAALEDAPLRACRASLLIQQRLADAMPVIESRFGFRPQMRIGINSGPQSSATLAQWARRASLPSVTPSIWPRGCRVWPSLALSC